LRSGDVCDASALESILPEHDVVVSTLGPRRPTRAACAIYSDSGTAIVEAMQRCGVSRVLVMSTALLFPSNRLSHRLLRWIARHNARSADLMEETLRGSSLGWTVVRVGFLNNKNIESCRSSVGALPDGGGSVSRAAVAAHILAAAREGKHLQEVVGLSG
jgi:hypothetical protein